MTGQISSNYFGIIFIQLRPKIEQEWYVPFQKDWLPMMTSTIYKGKWAVLTLCLSNACHYLIQIPGNLVPITQIQSAGAAAISAQIQAKTSPQGTPAGQPTPILPNTPLSPPSGMTTVTLNTRPILTLKRNSNNNMTIKVKLRSSGLNADGSKKERKLQSTSLT